MKVWKNHSAAQKRVSQAAEEFPSSASFDGQFYIFEGNIEPQFTTWIVSSSLMFNLASYLDVGLMNMELLWFVLSNHVWKRKVPTTKEEKAF